MIDVGPMMGFTFNDETKEWVRIDPHSPGDPITLGHGDIAFSLTGYGLGDVKAASLLLVGLRFHKLPFDKARKSGTPIEEDVVIEDYPVIQELRFLDVAGATVLRNALDYVIRTLEDRDKTLKGEES